MVAYVIGHITVKDEQKWQEYKSKVPATLEPYDAKLVFRGSMKSILSGTHNHKDTVVIKFPNTDIAEQWYCSDEYQELIPIREAAADIDLITFESQE